jgi:drug/metabolite transporter (DMT)-like permease
VLMSDKLRAYLLLHFCVLIWGFTAILGKLISLSALPLVWWRVFLCSTALWFFIPRSALRQVTRTQWVLMLWVGILVALHWMCFYGAVKLSNASVAVASMATTSFFSSFTEPFLLRQRVKWYETALSLLILPGMWLIVGHLDGSMILGFGVGIVGAFLAAVFSVLNKRIVGAQPPPPLLMTCVELSTAVLACSVALPFLWWQQPDTRFLPQGMDWAWLVLLAYLCTLLPYTLSIVAMRHISAFGTNLTINLEPVYGVLLAILFFREDKDLDPAFYVGVLIILVAVLSHPFLKQYFEKPTS